MRDVDRLENKELCLVHCCFLPLAWCMEMDENGSFLHHKAKLKEKFIARTN